MKENSITRLFGIRYPIIQGGMVWNSGWELAAAVSNAGGLGLIGSASMYPDVLETHLKKCRAATDKPFGVNLTLMYPDLEAHLELIEKYAIKIVFSSAGNPKLYTADLKKRGVKVVHVVSSLKFAQKAQDAGVDAVVAEGFEAGGHNGAEETTTFCLVPLLSRELDLPIIAAGGIATGAQILAAQTLGAEGVQLGSRFAASLESSGHAAFKETISQAKEGDTMLSLKEIAAVRLLKNELYHKIADSYARQEPPEKRIELLGKGRAKLGMFEGDLKEGKLEMGQSAYLIDDIAPVAEIMQRLVAEYNEALQNLKSNF